MVGSTDDTVRPARNWRRSLFQKAPRRGDTGSSIPTRGEPHQRVDALEGINGADIAVTTGHAARQRTPDRHHLARARQVDDRRNAIIAFRAEE